MTSRPCPQCGLTGGFHDRLAHAVAWIRGKPVKTVGELPGDEEEDREQQAG